jgi:hypothetical protein
MEGATDLTWRKSAKSGSTGDCVEIGTTDGQASGIRDSKRPHDGHLAITAATFGALLASVKAGRLDTRLLGGGSLRQRPPGQVGRGRRLRDGAVRFQDQQRTIYQNGQWCAASVRATRPSNALLMTERLRDARRLCPPSFSGMTGNLWPSPASLLRGSRIPPRA